MMRAILVRSGIAIALFALAATGGTARAGMQFQLVISEDGTNFTSGIIDWDSNPFVSPVTDEAELRLPPIKVGDFYIDMTVSASNSPGNGTYAHLGIGSVYIMNKNYVSAGTHALTIAVTATGYSAPFTSEGNEFLPYLTLESNASGNLWSNAGTTSARGSFTSYAGASDTPFDQSFAAPSITFALGQGATSYSGQTQQKPFYGNPDLNSYSLTTVGRYELSAGAILSNGSGNAFMHAPEPSSLVLAAAGFPAAFLALHRARRRRAPAI
jgi:hypothetical protein